MGNMICQCGNEMECEIRQGVFADVPWKFKVWRCRACPRVLEVDEAGNQRWIRTAKAAQPPTMFDPEIV